MTDFTIEDLRARLRECAGDIDGADLDGDTLDTPFVELGYDSLALLQVTAVISRERSIVIDDDAAIEAQTPRMLLKVINSVPRQSD
ncbi:act minimal PKS acyl carrier protein [Streptomyces sp. V3I8]|jgi:act minimal PKS acyl carrier protein|uniref:acyl carrier protein n=1 Tax=Streptomyces sp. V3I8 TaxID=3042279 RepID=UPI0027802EFF|nr:acyl carrier protein [Streptomyces sp. V3I8]MDQ1041640.1 act minimal PKS acyl carrier protein [Streptomyces sp. V3I8]